MLTGIEEKLNHCIPHMLKKRQAKATSMWEGRVEGGSAGLSWQLQRDYMFAMSSSMSFVTGI